jgi:hypothetical protein
VPQSYTISSSQVVVALKTAADSGDYCIINGTGGGGGGGGGGLTISTIGPGLSLVGGELKVNGGEVMAYSPVLAPSLSFGTVSANSCATQTAAWSGAQLNDPLHTQRPVGMEAAIQLDAFISSVGTVTVRACNISTSPVSMAAGQTVTLTKLKAF